MTGQYVHSLVAMGGRVHGAYVHLKTTVPLLGWQAQRGEVEELGGRGGGRGDALAFAEGTEISHIQSDARGRLCAHRRVEKAGNRRSGERACMHERDEEH